MVLNFDLLGGFSWFCFWSFGGVEIETGLDFDLICIFFVFLGRIWSVFMVLDSDL